MAIMQYRSVLCRILQDYKYIHQVKFCRNLAQKWSVKRHSFGQQTITPWLNHTSGIHLLAALQSKGGARVQNPKGNIKTKESEIILIEENGQPLTMKKREAEKEANLKGLKLVQISEDSDSLPTYKLMTGLQLHEERTRLREIKKASKPKDVKTIRVTSKINQHDLDIKSKHVAEWLEKGHKVKMIIKSKGEEDKGANTIFKAVTVKVKEIAKIVQAKHSATEMVFELRPNASEPSEKTHFKPKLFTAEELQEKKNENPQS